MARNKQRYFRKKKKYICKSRLNNTRGNKQTFLRNDGNSNILKHKLTTACCRSLNLSFITFVFYAKSRRSIYWTKITNFTSLFKKEIIDISVLETTDYSFACKQHKHQCMTVKFVACIIASNERQNHTEITL